MDINTKYDFSVFVNRALSSPFDDCYSELYNISMRKFASADQDCDGKIEPKEFSNLIETMSEFTKKFGINIWDGINTERTFLQIDTNQDGYISFDEWLLFLLKSFKAALGKLDTVPNKMTKDEYIKLIEDVKQKKSNAVKAVYHQLVKAFQAADMNRDGTISRGEFGQMLQMALVTPLKHGRNVSHLNHDVFEQLDTNGDGKISLDEWIFFGMSKIYI